MPWNRTLDGWAVNLDGSDAATTFALPRIELHSGARGWTCVCRLADGTSREVVVGRASDAAAVKRAGVAQARLALGDRFEERLRALR